MNEEKYVSVVIVDQQLEHKGILANATFVLGLTAGREQPAANFGGDVTDGDGNAHRYLTCISHHVRRAGQSKIRTLRERVASDSRVTVVDYSDDASTPSYDEYRAKLGAHSKEEIAYRAVHLFGPESVLVPLTKNLSRLE